jgi:hypothetical protein
MENRSAKELIEFIKPPDEMSILIGYLVGKEVLSSFERIYPSDVRPRIALEAINNKINGECNLGNKDINRIYVDLNSCMSFVADNADTYSYPYSYEVVYSARAIYFSYCTAYDAGYNNLAELVAIASYHAEASFRVNNKSSNVICNIILALVPRMIEYSIEHSMKLFTGSGDFTAIFDGLDLKTKELVVYNLDLFTKTDKQ